MSHQLLHMGIDMGSTTVKCVVLDEMSTILFSEYRRHDGDPLTTLLLLLDHVASLYPHSHFHLAFTGSQSSEYARWVEATYVQEVIAGSIAISRSYPQVRSSVELGGQDAKILFFSPSEGGALMHDMRMNGVCAGGTGAFLDQIAALLHIPIEEFEEYARRGTTLYDISGRCGVFAKTDIQPLLNQGVPREDIALSCLHALVKQTIGGLAQGMKITPPVLLAGGPCTFIPTLRSVFQKRLSLHDEALVVPQEGQTFIALGAAYALDTALAQGKGEPLLLLTVVQEFRNRQARSSVKETASRNAPFFSSASEQRAFYERYIPPLFSPRTFPAGTILPVYFGLDAGSTTTKIVLVSEEKEVLYTFYQANRGKPLDTAKKGLLEIAEFYHNQDVTLEVRGVGSTGYGEHLFAKAFGGDYHTVETLAHKEAACFYEPRATFVLDLGGQDMKAIFIRDGVITDMVLNEACSAGCGSFIESYSESLAIPATEIAPRAFESQSPSALGSRCTVFMNSSIITEQKNGKSVSDILAGLCQSVIENLFTKVVRVPSLDALGEYIVVQGGTFKNDAVLRAFVAHVGRDVVRPQFSGEMGAIGIALLAHAHADQWGKKSHFIGFEALKELRYEANEGDRCPFCANACARSVIRFSNGAHFVTGNRCERGEVLDEVSTQTPYIIKKSSIVPDMMRDREKLLRQEYNKGVVGKEKGVIGIPMVLDMYESLPFWATLFTRIGYRVIDSGRSSYKVFESGLHTIPSDTVCLPVKMVHGHVQQLIKAGVEYLFFPAMMRGLPENKQADDARYCALLQGYPQVIRISEFEKRKTPKLLTPGFYWSSEKLKRTQVLDFLKDSFDVSGVDLRWAYDEAVLAQASYRQALLDRGSEILAELRAKGSFGVLIAGRPYHGDMFINHGVADLFTSKGIPVLINEGIDLDSVDVQDSRIDSLNTFHTRMLAAAKYVALEPALELTQVVSFGCGHDAILSDEVDRLLRDRSDKMLLSLKVDEGENKGPLMIRITSFLETVRSRRLVAPPQIRPEVHPYRRRFVKQDAKKEILLPNLSRAFTVMLGAALEEQGYRIRVLPYADRAAIELGKKHVHNDICFPAQVNIGEHLAWLDAHPESHDSVAVLLAKNCRDCRAGHYVALARKALDARGYAHIPLITTDFSDSLDIHPGWEVNEARFNLFALRGFVLIDALDEMTRKCRPYELVVGSTDELHERSCELLANTLRDHGWRAAKRALEEIIEEFNALPKDRTHRRPRVGVIGEILINYHESGNYKVVEYLEQNGMEVVLPALIEFWRQDSINWQVMGDRGHSRLGKLKSWSGVAYEAFLDVLVKSVEKRMKKFVYYEPHSDIREIADKASEIIDLGYRVGEGWLLSGEILAWIDKGVMAHLIVQPFGCLPNHISGRGVVKAIKEMHPEVTILSLDFEPDTSLANIHNRLQMIILNAQNQAVKRPRTSFVKVEQV